MPDSLNNSTLPRKQACGLFERTPCASGTAGEGFHQERRKEKPADAPSRVTSTGNQLKMKDTTETPNGVNQKQTELERLAETFTVAIMAGREYVVRDQFPHYVRCGFLLAEAFIAARDAKRQEVANV